MEWHFPLNIWSQKNQTARGGETEKTLRLPVNHLCGGSWEPYCKGATEARIRDFNWLENFQHLSLSFVF